MAEERRKGLPDRRRTRGAKPAPPSEPPRGQDPNDVARFDAEQLDAAIREREQEDRGEVF